MVSNAQEVLKYVLGRLERGALNSGERAAFAMYFGEFTEDKLKYVHGKDRNPHASYWGMTLTRLVEKLKCLQAFADNPYEVEITLLVGDDHLFTMTLDGLKEDGGPCEVLVDTAVSDFYEVNNTSARASIKNEAIFPKSILPHLVRDAKRICDRPTLKGWVPSYDVSRCHFRTFDAQRMIFFCPGIFSSKKRKQGAPVHLEEGEDVKEGDFLNDMAGPATILIHELLHSAEARDKGGQCKYMPASSRRKSASDLRSC